MNISHYLEQIRTLYNSGQTTEHSFRPVLAALFQSIDPDIEVINEPKHLTEVGAPDFVFNRDGIAIGWCEAKDLGKDIQKFAANDYSKEQKKRYTKGLPNLIYTNGIDFEFIRDGEAIDFISIADFMHGIPAKTDQFTALLLRLKDFVAQTPISINTAQKLAQMMAGKAELIKHIMGNALVQDQSAGHKSELIGQFEAFKSNLIHEITMAEFADIYAETIAYGLFAARLHDQSQSTFSRAEALELLPKSNPFLRKLFIYIAGPDLDDRLRRVVDQLCDIFRATNLADLLKNFGQFTARNDPFIHFYETFLGEYNPKKRKSRGVWYTPEPVVNFIVRAVDDVLKNEFGLADGLADTSKITVDWDTGQTDNKGNAVTIKKDMHRVQILDPATGTGTFLAEVVKLVAGRVQNIAPAQWSKYVEHDLLPRLNGFELLMASYAMCHMKLDMMLTEMGYKPSTSPPRLQVYLTNSLEEGDKVEQNLFAQWLANEAKEASDIKRQTPIMCIIGNPPYAVSSSNKSPFIEKLMFDYKKDLNERNIQPLSDDYIKFLRYSQHLIEKNGEGVLGFITNNSYLDGLIHRQMRKDMLRAFDSIYVIDLHGSSKKQEKSPDGSADKNVFDIMQGVSIIIAVKKKGATVTGTSSGALSTVTPVSSTVTPAKAGVQKAKKLDSPNTCKGRGNDKVHMASVYHRDMWGSRISKNSALFETALMDKEFQTLETPAPNHYFVPKDFAAQVEYENGFSLKNLYHENGAGIETGKDAIFINSSYNQLTNTIKNITVNSSNYVTNTSSFKLLDKFISHVFSESKIKKIGYRPFDDKFVYYDINLLRRATYKVAYHLINKKNICINSARQQSVGYFSHAFINDSIIDRNSLSLNTREASYCFLLYLYPEEDSLDQNIRLNFDPKIYNQIRKAAGLSDAPFDGDNDGFRSAIGDARPDEIKIFDYIYGVLHCPAYRETYKEFLKIDFPHIPYPSSPDSFADISEKGEALRRLHLMEDDSIGDAPYPFDGEAPEDRDSMIDKPRYVANSVRTEPVDVGTARSEGPSTSLGRTDIVTGRVYINGTAGDGQYFANVPELAWEFYIGGYQPAQKWLKDRKGRVMHFDDIRHYQKIIKILSETHRIMQTIKI